MKTYTHSELVALEQSDSTAFFREVERFAEGTRVTEDNVDEIAERMFDAAPYFTDVDGNAAPQVIDADGYIIDPPAPYAEPGKMPSFAEVAKLITLKNPQSKCLTAHCNKKFGHIDPHTLENDRKHTCYQCGRKCDCWRDESECAMCTKCFLSGLRGE